MNCEQVIERLDAYVDREIGAAEAVRVEAHLDVCSDCAGEMDLIRACRCAYQGVELEHPRVDFAGRVMQALPQHVRGSARILRFSVRLAAAAAAVVLLVVLADLGWPDKSRNAGRSADPGLVAAAQPPSGTSPADGARAGLVAPQGASSAVDSGLTSQVAASLVVRYVSAMEQDLGVRIRATREASDAIETESPEILLLAAGEDLPEEAERGPASDDSVRDGGRPFPTSGFSAMVASLAGPRGSWEAGVE